MPGLPALQADLIVEYELPLLKEQGIISDIGDMGEAEAQDTLDVSGAYLIPMSRALDANGGLDVGAPAHFTVADDETGRQVRFLFEGGPPRGR